LARTAIEFGERRNVSFAQALGYEFLAENGIHAGDYRAGLKFAEKEREIVERIHSRERRAWTHFAIAFNSFLLGDLTRAENEYADGIVLAETIGERRVAALLKGNYAVVQAEQAVQIGTDTFEGRRLLDAALDTALQNFQTSEQTGLLYMRFDSHRCLAEVYLRRGELEDAERICAAAAAIVSGTESRVSRLWLGPIYLDVLLAGAKRLENEERPIDAEEKRQHARELLGRYQQLVAKCQSPRFTREAERLDRELGAESVPSA